MMDRMSAAARFVIAVGGATLALGGTAAAEEIGATELAVLAGGCANCHGTDGRLESGAGPAIAGEAAAVIEAKLLAFRADETPGATIMPRIAKGFTEDELRALAHHFAGIER
jgi:cytochrome subunit of sulfide dehydrogenase